MVQPELGWSAESSWLAICDTFLSLDRTCKGGADMGVVAGIPKQALPVAAVEHHVVHGGQPAVCEQVCGQRCARHPQGQVVQVSSTRIH